MTDSETKTLLHFIFGDGNLPPSGFFPEVKIFSEEKDKEDKIIPFEL